MTEDPFKGKKLLVLGQVIEDRKLMHVGIVESELREMKFDVNDIHCNENSAAGWLLDTWEATAYRLNSAMLTYVKTGTSLKTGNSLKNTQATALYSAIGIEHIPGIPEMTKLEEIELPEVKSQVKTASTAKKFGI